MGHAKPSDLTSIGHPVLIANGDDDTMVPTSNSLDLADRLPDATLRIYPDAGHGGYSSTTHSLWTMPCSFSSREAISHDHQSHAQTSWIRRSSPPFRGIGRAHPWIYHRTGGRVGCKLRLGAGFRKPVPTLLLNTGAASPARTSSHHCFTSPTVTMSSSLPLPLGRQKTRSGIATCRPIPTPTFRSDPIAAR